MNAADSERSRRAGGARECPDSPDLGPRPPVLAVLAAVAALLSALACADDVARPQPPSRPQVRSLTVEPEIQQLSVGQRFTFGARVIADSGVSTTVRWTTSNAAVVPVDAATGEVTLVAPGSALITATTTAPGPMRSATASVITAGHGLGEITATPRTIALVAGTTQTLVVSLAAVPGIARTVTCTSSAPDVAIAAPVAGNTTCTVVAVEVGTATVTIASTVAPTITASVGVTVTRR